MLLVSELISNALKHASGEVRISLRCRGDALHLEVSDDGIGFPPDFDASEAANTGLELVETFARF